MFNVFAFGFETRIKQSSHWSIAWSMKLCWLLTTFQSHATSAHWFLINMSLHVGFSRYLQALVHWCGFHAASGESEWCTLLWCLAFSSSYCKTSVKLLATFAFQRTTREQEHWAAATQDSRLHTRRGIPQTRPQSCRLQIIYESFRNAYIRNIKGRQTSLMSCGY